MSLNLIGSTIDELDLNASRHCLHVSQPWTYEAVAAAVTDLCDRSGRTLAITEMPRPQPFKLRLMRRPNVFDWFSTEASTDLAEARQTIEEFPIAVHPDFRCNALNPLRFLGLAVAITRGADVLMYESSGMDPMGISAIHKYALKCYTGCLIHVSWQPLGVNCLRLTRCQELKHPAKHAT